MILIHADGLLAAVEITGLHMSDMGFGVSGPGSHGMGVLLGVFLDRLSNPAVGISFAQDGIDRGAENFGIGCPGGFFGIALRIVGKIGEIESLSLQFADRFLKLGNGGTDIREFDNICFRSGGELTQFGQGIGDTLVLVEGVREMSKDPGGEGNIPGFKAHPTGGGEYLQNGEK